MTLLYIIIISLFILGWSNTAPFRLDKKGNYETVSVVVACKNEKTRIPQLLESLLAQNYQNFELIIIDDNSTDDTILEIEKYGQKLKNMLICKATGNGKKDALKQGILLAKGELIITTDADCITPPNWIETILNFQAKNNSDLIVCPTVLLETKNLFSRIQKLEFTSLIITSAGSAKMGMPILCNGANLAFKKNAWIKSQGELHQEELSGDDIFLLQSINKRGGRIMFLKSKQALVKTRGAETISKFILLKCSFIDINS